MTAVVDDGGDEHGVVALRFQQAVEFANIGGGKAVVVTNEDIEGRGGGEEEGKKSGRRETHRERLFGIMRTSECALEDEEGPTILSMDGNARQDLQCCWEEEE